MWIIPLVTPPCCAGVTLWKRVEPRQPEAIIVDNEGVAKARVAAPDGAQAGVPGRPEAAAPGREAGVVAEDSFGDSQEKAE